MASSRWAKKPRQKRGSHRKGKKMTDEHKRKISQSMIAFYKAKHKHASEKREKQAQKKRVIVGRRP